MNIVFIGCGRRGRSTAFLPIVGFPGILVAGPSGPPPREDMARLEGSVRQLCGEGWRLERGAHLLEGSDGRLRDGSYDYDVARGYVHLVGHGRWDEAGRYWYCTACWLWWIGGVNECDYCRQQRPWGDGNWSTDNWWYCNRCWAWWVTHVNLDSEAPGGLRGWGGS